MVKSSIKSKGSMGHPPKSNQELDEKAQKSARVAVIGETDKRTGMKIFTMTKWLSDRGEKNPDGTIKTVMDAVDFSRFLESHVTKKGKGVTSEGIDNGNAAHSWRTAWKKWRVLLRMDVQKDDPGVGLINLQIKGKKYKAGAPDNTSPDVIDSGRLHKMVPLLKAWGEIMYAVAFLMIFYGGFRKTRGSQVKVKDIRFGTDIGTVITTARMKSANAVKAAKPGMIGNVKEVNNLTRFLEALVKDKGPDDNLFDGWTDKKANDLIKRVAHEHAWGSGNWVVTSLRHGAAREGLALVEDEPTIEEKAEEKTKSKVAKRLGHTSDASQKHYQTSNEPKKRRT